MRPDTKEKSRKLSPAEQRRLDRFEKIGAELAEQGYTKTELTIGIVKANILTIVAGIPIMILGVVLFFLKNPLSETTLYPFRGSVIFLVSMLVLIVVHELIHGLTWSFFAERGWKDIEFGFMKEYLTPYCTCGVPLSKGGYILGTLMPLIVLGVIPTVAAILTGAFLLLWIGLVMILAAGGDVMIVLKMLLHRSAASEILYFDHPTRAGIVVFER